MNVKRFTGRSSREAMQKVRLAYGDNAVVLSTQPCVEGIEILAMAPETVARIERFQDQRAQERSAEPAPARALPASAARAQAGAPQRSTAQHNAVQHNTTAQVQADVGTLAMSTLSFQDYVRERMLKKRQAEMRAQAAPVPVTPEAIEQRLLQREMQREQQAAQQQQAEQTAARQEAQQQRAQQHQPQHQRVESCLPAPDGGESDFIPDTDMAAFTADQLLDAPLHNDHDARRLASKMAGERRAPAPSNVERALRAQVLVASQPQAGQPPAERRRSTSIQTSTSSNAGHTIAPHELADHPAARGLRQPAAAPADASSPEMMRELRAMKGMIEERFGALAFMERMQKNPRQAQLATKLMECGFSPALIRKLVDSLGEDVSDEVAWAGEVLQRNLVTAEQDQALEDQGGVYALVGSTGVGKTTSTAKLAAAFATKHGAANLGLITLDAYRLGAHEQLRAYGRILGVPVHTAHDRVALEDLLELLAGKRLVLIDTAGLAQRDTRTRELLEMLSHPSIHRVLVVNAAAQGETIEDVLVAYKAASACGIVLSKLDEAVKLGPALDALIRHRLKVVAVANGQRVPEDWHRLTAQALIHRALRSSGSQAWRMDSKDVSLMFAAPPSTPQPARRSGRSSAGRTPG
jgi:flagellar biosynthesis protein FlhF